MTTYYRFRLDGKLEGLVRKEENRERGSVFSRAGDEGWTVDQALFRYLVEPSDVELVEVSEAEARAVAFAYGIEL